MKKKLIIFTCFMLTMLLIITSQISVNAISQPFDVKQANAKVLVNGVLTDFEAYNINGNNYFKLRDIAVVVSGTQKQFEVTWDADRRAINLVSNSNYTPSGNELSKSDSTPKQATQNSSPIYKDGNIINLTAYNIGGNNFFKLRDLTQAFNIGVTWDGATSTVGIDTTLDYMQASNPVSAPVTTEISQIATPLTTKLLVDGVEKKLEAYTINNKEYFKLNDLSVVLNKTEKDFSVKEYTDGNFTVISTDIYRSSKTASRIVQGDGTKKEATLIMPKVYFNGNEIRFITIYDINGKDYYPLDELMELLRCGVIRDKNANTVNLVPKKLYEPEFSPIPAGNAAYQKLQQDLYDAYFRDDSFRGEYIDFEGRITVPDNATLYVPNGVTLDTSGSNRIFLGNNSTFYVRGDWIVEYPDKVLFPISKQTKNSIYIDEDPFGSYQPQDIAIYQKLSSLTTGVIVRLDGGNWAWNETDIPFESASFSYGSSSHGLEQILLNFERDEKDIKQDLKLVLHERNGKTHTIMYRNVRNSIDLMPKLAGVVGESIGKNTTITKVDVFNYYIGEHDNPDNEVVLKPITIPVNWNIATTGTKPSGNLSAEIDQYSDLESLVNIHGLTNNTYIAKYTYAAQSNRVEINDYSLISPEHDFTIRHLDFADEIMKDTIVGNHTNIALIKGAKGTTQNSYDFKVSPLSSDLLYVANVDYPSEASLVVEGNKTYLNFKMVNFKGLPLTGKVYRTNIMVKAQMKDAPDAPPEVIFSGSVAGDRIDITPYLTSQIDKLYVYGYKELFGGYKIPSKNFFEITMTNSTFSIESVELGEDTNVNISKFKSSGSQGIVTSNVKFINNDRDIEKIQISPTGENVWTDVLVLPNGELDKFAPRTELTLPMTFDSSKLWDIKITTWPFGDVHDIKEIDFSGISSKPGATIEIKYLLLTGKTVVIVSGSTDAPAPKAGDYNTDTIDVILVAGENVKNFDVSDFSLVFNDVKKNKYPYNDIRIIDLSPTTAGNAKLTIARDLIPKVNLNNYFNQLNLYYKDYEVGTIYFNAWQ